MNQSVPRSTFAPNLPFVVGAGFCVTGGTDGKAAAEMAQAIQWLSDSARQQAKLNGKSGTGLDSLKREVNGQRILISLVCRKSRSARVCNRCARVSRERRHRTYGPGTISVQSPEGTVIIPAG